MNRLVEWFAMGGYSMYVWSAYGAVSAAFFLNFIGIKWKKKHTQRTLEQWFKR